MKKFSKQKEQEIIKMYTEGMTQQQIAKEFYTWNTSIRRVLLRNNINIRSNSEIQRIVKFNPFKDLTNPDTMYWLGFICADGNIGKNTSRISLDTVEKDIDHLQKYIDFIGCNGLNINTWHNKKFDVVECKVAFHNSKVKDFLIDLGITPLKTFDLKINFKITWDFLRGFIDGDGYIRKQNQFYSFTIPTASKEFHKQISEFLKQQDIHHTQTIVDNLYVIGVYTNDVQKKMFTNLYKNANTYLKRKYLIFGSSARKLVE